MKKVLKIGSALLLLVVILAASQCTKKADADTCKTCKAKGGVDQGTIQKQVCTPAEEQEFRDANAGRTITCN
jgi:hypothetical protein